MRSSFLPILLVAMAPGCRANRGLSPDVASASFQPGSDWLADEAAICGEVRGRVLDAETGRPLRGAYVVDDSLGGGVSTDSLGRFRLVSTKLPAGASQLMRSPRLRVRQLGRLGIGVYLPADLGYVVEIRLAQSYWHKDHITTVRIKDPGFCEPAS